MVLIFMLARFRITFPPLRDLFGHGPPRTILKSVVAVPRTWHLVVCVPYSTSHDRPNKNIDPWDGTLASECQVS